MFQKGIAHILVLVAAAGVVGFLLISSTFSFKDNLFSGLFSKPASHAQVNGDQTANLENLGNPAADAGKSGFARNVWDMQSFDGRVYINMGDAGVNTHPIPIVSYNGSA